MPVFELFSTEPFNVVADSAYVVGLVQRIADAMIKEVKNKQLFSLLLKLATLLKNRVHVYFMMHIRSHATLPGPITKGKAVADKLTIAAVLPHSFEQARLSHDLFHENASSLHKQFALSQGQATEIVCACPNCQHITPVPSCAGVNPRGLRTSELWQSDVTHSDHQSFTTAADCQFGWSPHLWLDQKYGIKNLGDHNGQVL